MRKGKFWIVLMTVLLLAVAVFSGIMETEGNLTLSAVVNVNGREEEISLWQDLSGTAYLILPGCARLEDVKLRVVGNHRCALGDVPLKNGMNCGAFSLEESYAVSGLRDKDPHARTVVFLQTGGVGTVFLETASGTMEHIHESKGNKEPGTMRLYSRDGQLEYSGIVDTISGRGNSSWNEAKKSYNLELNTQADLLGMGSAQKWILQANAMDRSHLRNKLIFDFADAAGLAYSPDAQWADLYLNGEYAGLYLLCERNEVHPQRVNIPQEDSFLVSKDYSWRFDREGDPYIETDSKAALRIYYSDMDAAALRSLWQSAENAILAEDGVDPVTGKHWMDLIDMESWVRKFLIEEVFGNIDGPTLSQFFYLDGSRGDGRICAGPVWDYDLSLGNDYSVDEGGENRFYVNREGLYGSPWPAALYKKDLFYDAFTREYETRFRPMLEDLLETGLDRYAGTILPAAQANQIRWNGSTAAEETEIIRSFLTKRMSFLDDLWLSGSTYHTVRVIGHDDSAYDYAVADGAVLPRLIRYENDPWTIFHGWYYEGTDEPIDPNRPVTEDLTVYLKYEILETPGEEPVEEPLTLLRILPLLLLVAAFAGLLLTGVRQSILLHPRHR